MNECNVKIAACLQNCNFVNFVFYHAKHFVMLWKCHDSKLNRNEFVNDDSLIHLFCIVLKCCIAGKLTISSNDNHDQFFSWKRNIFFSDLTLELQIKCFVANQSFNFLITGFWHFAPYCALLCMWWRKCQLDIKLVQINEAIQLIDVKSNPVFHGSKVIVSSFSPRRMDLEWFQIPSTETQQRHFTDITFTSFDVRQYNFSHQQRKANKKSDLTFLHRITRKRNKCLVGYYSLTILLRGQGTYCSSCDTGIVPVVNVQTLDGTMVWY